MGLFTTDVIDAMRIYHYKTFWFAKACSTPIRVYD